MEIDSFDFWCVCLLSLFLGRVISSYLFPEPAKFLEAYGGCECDNEDYKKFDVIYSRGKRYRRLIQETNSKMPYRYSKIYNATQGVWAHNVAGEDDPQQVWEDNEWDENDALVGFYSDGESDFHNVIFCRPGYAVYVLGEEDKERAEFDYDNTQYRIPPVMLVNLNDAYDGEFMYNKSYPDDNNDTEMSDSSSEESDDSVEDRVHTHIPENQRIINFLYKCRDATDSQYKKNAYDIAIDEIYNYWGLIYPNTWEPCTIGPNIERKIREFLDGIPEDDIINS